MSVRENERNVPQTPTNKMLDCLWEARNLSLYTVRICSNTNNFPPEYYQTMTGDTVKAAKNIYRLGRRANSIRIREQDDKNKAKEKWDKRSKYQCEAILLCTDLLSDIDIAKPLFNIRGKRVKYWCECVTTARKMYVAWHKADEERYEKLIKDMKN